MNVTAEGETDSANTQTGSIALLLLGSGLCSLVYQTVWLREMRGVFGSSTSATAAVIGIFMGGLGLGGFLFGRIADRHPNPLRLYSKLEIGVALSAFATIPLGALVKVIYFASGGSVSLGLGVATLLRLGLAVLLLGVPTVLMGGTLPAVARAVVGERDLKRRAIALLYGVNTIGAVVGTIGATFFTLEQLGNRMTLIVSVLVNLLVAISARAMSRREGCEREPEVAVESVTTERREREAPAIFTWSAAVVAGFSFLLLELVWYRMLAPILGGSTFTFGLILAMALLGIGLGGILYALVSNDRPATLPLFAATCGIEALAIVAPFALGDRIAVLAALLREVDVLGFAGTIFAWVIVCSIVVLPAALIAGFQFPALIALAGRGSANVGTDVGRVYAFNTLGAIAGSLAGGFGLLPLLSATGCWQLAGWLMVALCAATTLVGTARRRVAIAGPAFATIAAVLLFGSSGPTAAWRHVPIGGGRVDLSGKSTNELVDWQRLQRRSIFFEFEGVESSVALRADDGYSFFVNGKSDGHLLGDAATQVMSGLLGAMLHPQARQSLVIGLGTGSTAGWLGKVPGMERVDVAELEPEIRKVALECAPVNQHVLEQKNVHVFYGDARELLLVSRNHYDVVFSEPSNPYRAGIAGLFTTEFYDAVSKRLADGGIFLQWVQAYEIDPRTTETIIRTMQGVFPYVQVWVTLDRDILLVATKERLMVDAGRIRERVAVEPYRSALRQTWKTDTVEGVLAHMVADDEFAAYVARTTLEPPNTDDRNVVEFGFARSVGSRSRVLLTELRAFADGLGMRNKSITGEVDHAMVDRYRRTSGILVGSEPPQDNDLGIAVAAYQQQRFADAFRAWERTGLEPISHSETLLVAESLAQMRDGRCLDYLNALRGFDPVDALLVEAIYRSSMNESAEAVRLLARGFELSRSWPWGDNRLASRAGFLAEQIVRTDDDEAIAMLEGAFSKPFAVGRFDNRRRQFLLAAALRRDRGSCGPRTIAALVLSEPHTPWQRDFLRIRALCYTKAGHPLAGRARSELAEFQEHESEPFGAGLKDPQSPSSGSAPSSDRE